MAAYGSALLGYAIVIYIQKLIQVIKSNTAGFLRIQKHNDNDNEKHIFSENNVQCYECIICKSMLGKKT